MAGSCALTRKDSRMNRLAVQKLYQDLRQLLSLARCSHDADGIEVLVSEPNMEWVS
jgi:hypothetical protein